MEHNPEALTIPELVRLYGAYAKQVSGTLPVDDKADERLDAFVAERHPYKGGRPLKRVASGK